jgi:peptidoglycan/xylan/chitin deacetylase (PgdA/CDA1 family)
LEHTVAGLKRTVVIVLVVVVVLVPAVAKGTMFIVFRYDDFRGDPEGLRQTDPIRKQLWQAEQGLYALFKKQEMQFVISVIPCSGSEYDGSETADTVCLGQDKEKCGFIKRAVESGTVEVAQHGLSHTNHAKEKHRKAEFGRRDYEAQLGDMRSGKQVLCSACGLDEITTFVPPWNSWDRNTASILSVTGYEVLSGDRLLYSRIVERLTIIPGTASLEDLEAVADGSGLPANGVMVVLFHPKDITRIDGYEGRPFGIGKLDQLLSKVSTMPDTKVVTFQWLARNCNDLTNERYRLAARLFQLRHFWRSLLPVQLLPGTQERHLYLSAYEYSTLLSLWMVITAVFGAILFAVGLVVRRLLSMRLSLKWRLRIDLMACSLFVLSILKEIQIVYKGYPLTAVSSMPAFLTAGFVLALLGRAWKRYG